MANFYVQIYILLMIIVPVNAWNRTYSALDILYYCGVFIIVILLIIIFAFLFVFIVYGIVLVFIFLQQKQQHQPNIVKNKISTEEERVERTQSTTLEVLF
ncbi:unnamed protein product [Meloidogyne enterolobii]|uniref:Uncharacterized protein n=1 Tax=Meloidogyne enterolobii TaxID=390850 RepID=A0ACB0XV27_MELEN